MIRTAKEAINALGGPTQVADWLHLDQSTVSAWGTRGEIGRGWHLYIYFSLRRRGFQVAPTVFGVSDWADVQMPTKRRLNGSRRKGH